MFAILVLANIARIPLTVMAPCVVLLWVYGTCTVHGSPMKVGLMLLFGLVSVAAPMGLNPE